MNDLCPKIPLCRLFNDNLLKRAESVESYKNGYCRNSARYKECKRYIISEKVGKCADFIMPNSMLTIEQIIERMKKEGLEL